MCFTPIDIEGLKPPGDLDVIFSRGMPTRCSDTKHHCLTTVLLKTLIIMIIIMTGMAVF